MDRYKKLQSVANAINAATEIRSLYASNSRNNSRHEVRPDNISLLNNVLKIISEYMPGSQSRVLEETTNKCNSYSCAYKNLKQNIRALGSSQAVDKEIMIRILNLMKPFMQSRQSHFIDKFTKIYEILQS
jgi:hypothetical protein